MAKTSWANLTLEPKKEAVIPENQSTTKPEKTALVGGHFPEYVRLELKKLALEENVTLRDLLIEAIDDIMIKKGKKPVFAGKNK
jgi:hypothetical protein